MDRRGRRDADSRKGVSFFTWGGIILIAVVAFIVAYVLYSNNLSTQAKNINNTQKISSTDNNRMNMIGNTEAASSSIGKSVNELENTTKSTTNTENTNKMAVNTSKNEENKNLNNKNENNKNEKEEKPDATKNNNVKENTATENVTNVEQVEKTKDPTFINPVDGEKIKDYSSDNLVYSVTLDEWTTHLGIDYKSEKTDIVKASADGKIKSIKNDPRYGLTVVIEHANGFESVYSNLLTAEFITVGEEVKQGQTIATVGNTARFEIADETHLHFEIKQNGESVDPNIYLK